MDHGMRDQVLGGPGGGGWGGMEHGLSGGVGWWFALSLTFITLSLITLAVVAVMVWLRGRSAGGASPGGDPEARARLDQRLAAGEIGPDDYTRRLAMLRAGGLPPAGG